MSCISLSPGGFVYFPCPSYVLFFESQEAEQRPNLLNLHWFYTLSSQPNYTPNHIYLLDVYLGLPIGISVVKTRR